MSDFIAAQTLLLHNGRVRRSCDLVEHRATPLALKQADCCPQQSPKPREKGRASKREESLQSVSAQTRAGTTTGSPNARGRGREGEGVRAHVGGVLPLRVLVAVQEREEAILRGLALPAHHASVTPAP